MMPDSTQPQLTPVFAYWTDDDQSPLAQLKSEWQAEFPHFQVFGDRQIIPLIERYFPGHIDLFQALRIPTAKSDIARLLLLYEFGGLYVDCHCGIRDADEIRRLMSSLEQVELILIDRIQSMKPRRPGEHYVLMTIIFSRPRSDLILLTCRQAFANLAHYRERVRNHDKGGYNVPTLVGTRLFNETVFQPGTDNRHFRPGYEGRILIVPEEVGPIERNRNRTYGGPGQHWSERQKVEPLFEH
jgi:hypothetical protein